MSKRNYELSPKCTPGVIKANTGRNTQLNLHSIGNRSPLYPKSWTIHAKINWKTLSADPSDFYDRKPHLEQVN